MRHDVVCAVYKYRLSHSFIHTRSILYDLPSKPIYTLLCVFYNLLSSMLFYAIIAFFAAFYISYSLDRIAQLA